MVPRDHFAPRAPHLGRNRIKQVVYTDTAFSDIRSRSGNTCFQLFVHAVSMYLSLFPLRGKSLVNVSLQDFCRYDETPNHLHGDNANELMNGEALATCRKKRIKVTATEADHPNQNHAADL